MLLNHSRKWARRSLASAYHGSTRIAQSSIPSSNPPFVSKHYEVNPSELTSLITKSFKDVRRNDSSETVEIKKCFNDCVKERKGMADNAWKLNIRQNGSYYCYRCSSGGNWYDLKRRLSKAGALNVTSNSSDASVIDPSNEDSHSHDNIFPSSSNSDDLEMRREKTKPYVIPDQQSAFDHHKALLSAIMLPLPPANSSAPYPVSTSSSSTKEKSPSPQARHHVLHYLRHTRGLSDEVLLRYGVGVGVQAWMDDSHNNEWVDKVTVTFPWMTTQAEFAQETQNGRSSDTAGGGEETSAALGPRPKFLIQRIKHRAIETKGLQRILPKRGRWGFFGWHVVSDAATEIIITEGEYDAMAAAQGLHILPDNDPLKGVPAISLPNGCNSLPPDLIPLLERFTKIYLWLDNDKSGQDAADKFARKLGVGRCVIVKPLESTTDPPKDANDALRQTLHQFVAAPKQPAPRTLIADLIRAAKPVAHRRLETFSHLREEVLRNIRTPLTELSGTGTPSLPTISSIIKGFRRGELTILTGPTGGGKTTLLSQMSVDFVRAGVPTLWGSFEIKNSRLVEKQLQQYHTGSGSLRSLSHEKLDSLADDFESLPLHYMNFHSSTELSQIIDAMDFAVYRDDVQHIIIDNLQFMIPRGGVGGRGGSNMDKFSAQDHVLDEFRKFATEKNVNIILVIHPRKEDEGAPLGMNSIFGTAKSTQEADVVLILQRTPAGLCVAVKKNRYCGTLGKVDLGYNTICNVFYELSKAESDERNAANRERERSSTQSWSGGGGANKRK